MPAFVTIRDTVLHALLDSGSTHNFVDSEAAACVGIVFNQQIGLRVTMAKGDRVASTSYYNNLRIAIIDEVSAIECYGLALGSYEMVLGIQWLESLGPVLWDFKNRMMSFKRHGRAVKWSASAPLESLVSTIATATGDVMEALLLRSAPLFAEPRGLPPSRQRCHQIRLLPGTPHGCSTISVCPTPEARIGATMQGHVTTRGHSA
jgi:hypothetical protein